MKRCAIIAASPSFDTAFLRRAVQKDDFVICADGGYSAACQAEIKPDLVVGDFDSCKQPGEHVPVIVLPTHKDDTDTMFAIKEGLKRGYKNFVLLGALGGRPDHTFANFCALQYLYENGACGMLADAKAQVYFVPEGEFTVKGKKGFTLSVFPFGCASCTVTHRGFEYELAKEVITSSFPLGISNVVTSDNAGITFHTGSALVMLFKQGHQGEKTRLLANIT